MDEALRRLRLAACGGDRQATHALVRALQRSGAVTPELELVAYLLEPDAGALGPAACLPRGTTAPGARFELAGTPSHGLELTWHDPTRGSAWAELDARYAGIPRGELHALLAATVQLGVRHLVLDLREVHGLTSGGMADLSKLKQRLDEAGGSLGMLLSERIRVPVELMGLAPFLGLHEDPAQATAQLEAAGPLPPARRGSSRWLSGILRWGPRRAEQAALCLAAHAGDSPELWAAFERACASGAAPSLSALPPLPSRAQRFLDCVEVLHRDGCWPDDAPQLTAEELEGLVEFWVPKLLA
ncbi:MAG: STAS domain-containing protein [Planctomycetes bacterium]|nr:STAS domain-containing protein [Planctomycetota bacterium]